MKPGDFDREELHKLYKLAIEEYRFQVLFNWDRTKQYLILNTAIVTVAFGILQIGSGRDVAILSAGTFLVGVLSAVLGWQATQTGHVYYRGTVFKVALIGDLLELHKPVEGYAHDRATLHVATLAGSTKVKRILADPDAYLRANEHLPSRETVTFGTLLLFGLFLIIDLAGFVIVLFRIMKS